MNFRGSLSRFVSNIFSMCVISYNHYFLIITYYLWAEWASLQEYGRVNHRADFLISSARFRHSKICGKRQMLFLKYER